MSHDVEKRELKVSYEPPQLLRLSTPRDADAVCLNTGSGDQTSGCIAGPGAGACNSGAGAATNPCMTGPQGV